jgi:hypothetical protein
VEMITSWSAVWGLGGGGGHDHVLGARLLRGARGVQNWTPARARQRAARVGAGVRVGK